MLNYYLLKHIRRMVIGFILEDKNPDRIDAYTHVVHELDIMIHREKENIQAAVGKDIR